MEKKETTKKTPPGLLNPSALDLVHPKLAKFVKALAESLGAKHKSAAVYIARTMMSNNDLALAELSGRFDIGAINKARTTAGRSPISISENVITVPREKKNPYLDKSGKMSLQCDLIVVGLNGRIMNFAGKDEAVDTWPKDWDTIRDKVIGAHDDVERVADADDHIFRASFRIKDWDKLAAPKD